MDAHVADALVALDLDEVRAALRVADLGSGAGFPGLVLAAALPEAEVSLVEASAKKCEFLTRATEAMGLDNVVVVAERAEEWDRGMGRCDLVTARAVGPLNVLVEYAAPLLEHGGALVAWKGRRDETDERDGDAASAATGLGPAVVRAVRPWNGAEHLHLHLYVKVEESAVPVRVAMGLPGPPVPGIFAGSGKFQLRQPWLLHSMLQAVGPSLDGQRSYLGGRRHDRGRGKPPPRPA